MKSYRSSPLTAAALLAGLALFAPLSARAQTHPPVSPPPLHPVFSPQPTVEEITRARIFGEPLVPVRGVPSPKDNQELVRALRAYLQGGGGENVGPLVVFLESHSVTPWRASLLTNLGIVYRRTGYFSRALEAWQEAWAIAKGATGPKEKAVAYRAVGELAQLMARLGRYQELEALLAELEGRDIGGSAGEMIDGAKQALWLMQTRPEMSFRCGPLGLDRVLAYGKPDYQRDPKIAEAQSTAQGTSLLQVRDLALSLGHGFQMAQRTDPRAEVIVPAVIHWRSGHFAGLVAAEHGRYLIQDPTFREELWVSRRALEDEASGFALVREGPLPAGWRRLTDEEGGRVWGKGATAASDPQSFECEDHQSGSGCAGGRCLTCACSPEAGMATYSFHTMLVSLHISDSPVGHAPPRGPSVRFMVNYHQREVFQPQIFFYSNLGPKWTSNWLSYLEDDPATPSQPVYLYVRSGGQQTYSGYNPSTQSYAPNYKSRATVVRVSTSPLRYDVRRPDGSVDVYAQPDGALTFPRKVFLTESIDPQGNKVTLTYDASLRLVSLADAIGQVTTLSYELAGDPLKITKVTDPFGRFARFEYDGSGRLFRITDVINIQSSFAYGTGDLITSMTTPYGTTSFAGGEEGRRRWLEATDPLGGRERLEYLNTVGDVIRGDELLAFPYGLPGNEIPTGFFPGAASNYIYRNTFFWSKRASALAAGDYRAAKLIHWLHHLGLTQTAGVIENEKEPLETMRTFYKYPNQGWQETGSHVTPSGIGRVMEDGASQIWQYEYNAAGNKIKAIDPVGRETVYVYGTGSTPDTNPTTGSGIDLLQVKQKNGASYDLLSSSTYNAQHLPLTTTDAAGQTTNYTYNAQGQLLMVVTPPRGGLSLAERTTTYSYNTNGYPQSVTGPLPGSTTSYTYDGYGRIRTVTDPDNYTLTYDYDALDRQTKITYPDGTYEETVYNRLDPEKRRDRQGRWSQTLYDALRRPVASKDLLGRTTTQLWCACGSLDKIIDPNGNATSWEYDQQGRVKREIRPDGAAWEYTYENTSSRLKQKKDAKNQIAGYEYFLDDKLKRATYSGAVIPTADVSYTYDPIYDRVATMTDGIGTTSYTYHPITASPALGAGQLASVDGPLANDTVSYTYDELGRVASRGLSGFSSSFSFDALGRLTTQASPVGNFGFTYDGVTSRPLSLSYPNGQMTQYTYFLNSGDHLLQQTKHLAPGGATISKYDYTYSLVGNILTWSQQVGANPAKLYTLGYDPADQLTSARITGPTPLPVPSRFAYAYDAASNRSAEQLDDAVTGASYNNRNELLSRQPGGALLFRGTLNETATVTIQGKPVPVPADNTFLGQAQAPSGSSNVVVAATDPSGNTRTNTYQVSQSGATTSYTYDLNGNLAGDGTKTYEWDAENRLTAVKQGGVTLASFSYDGQGRRAQKVAGGVTGSYVYDGDNVIEERLSTGGTLRYVHGQGTDQHLAMQNGAVVSYYLADHLGSIVQQTDSAGAVTVAKEYDPYGNMLSGTSQSGYAFTGREWDPETGLYYYRARYYDPKIGRFISEDPIGFDGGVNFYAYVKNNPVNWIDPLGLRTLICFAFSLPGQPKLVTSRWAIVNYCDMLAVCVPCGLSNEPAPPNPIIATVRIWISPFRGQCPKRCGPFFMDSDQLGPPEFVSGRARTPSGPMQPIVFCEW